MATGMNLQPQASGSRGTKTTSDLLNSLNERDKAIHQLIGFVYIESHQHAPEPGGAAWQAEMHVWRASLTSIPTQHIGTCGQRAMANKRDDYMLKPSAVTREWDYLKEELATRQQQQASKYTALPAGPVEVCPDCKGAGWMVDYTLPISRRSELVRCFACNGPVADQRRATGSPMHFPVWREHHLSVCGGCDDSRFSLAHARPEKGLTLMDRLAANFASGVQEPPAHERYGAAVDYSDPARAMWAMHAQQQTGDPEIIDDLADWDVDDTDADCPF